MTNQNEAGQNREENALLQYQRPTLASLSEALVNGQPSCGTGTGARYCGEGSAPWDPGGGCIPGGDPMERCKAGGIF